jgi:RecA-family ATPase
MNAVVQPIFTPDVSAMRQHVEHLFGGYLDGCHEGLIELSWTDTRPDQAGRYRLANAKLFGTDKLDELVDEAARLNATPMCNVYIGAALRHPDTAPFGRAQDRDAWALTCAYVDLDDAEAATNAKNIYGLDKPTLVVVTGRAPHTRAQLWWRLEEPLKDAAHWPALLRGFAAKLHGDSTVTNPSRVMRLAGTIAWPVKPGRTVELTSIAPLREPGRCEYSPEHLARAFPPVAGAASVAQPGHINHTTNSLGLADKINDGREAYMRDTISACLIELIGTTGATPTAQELYDAAWPQYERKVDLSRGGRGADEFAQKCAYTIARFERGDIRGIETLDKAIDVYNRKQAKQASQVVAEALQAPTPVDDPREGPFLASELTGAPAERQWIAQDWIPMGVITGLSGDGGMGKTLLAQQLLYAAGVGGSWLGIKIPKLRGMGVFCEDDSDELHRRHNAIKIDMGFKVGNPFDSVWIWPRVGSDNLLVTFDKDNKPTASPFFAQIMRHVLEHKIELLVLDTIADLFGGNEIIRAQVNFFIKAICGAFIKEAKAAGFTLTVILLSHPSQAGRNSGSGESGSTAWNNAVRARLYLTRPEDGIAEQRVLTRKKSNYSASGDDVKLDLLWVDGVLKTAAESHDSAVAIRSIESQILQQVKDAWDMKRPFKAKKGAPRFLDTAMVEIFRPRVPVTVIVTALNNVKRSEKITVDRVGDVRGWRVTGDENDGVSQ